VKRDRLDNKQRLPVPALLAVLVAFVSEFVSHPSPVIPVLTVVLLASQLIPLRFESRFLRNWVVRIMVGVGLYMRSASATTAPWYFLDPQMTDLVADMCAAEVVLRCWLAWTDKSWRGALVVLYASVTLMFSTNTTSTSPHFLPIVIEAPVYVWLLGMAFPAFFPLRPEITGSADRLRSLVLRALVVSVVVGVGYGLYDAFWRFQQPLSQWGESLIREDVNGRVGTLNTAPELGNTFGLQGSTSRVLRVDGLPNPAYLRALAFEIYVNGQWIPEIQRRNTVPYTPQAVSDPTTFLSAHIERLNADKLVVAPIETEWFGFEPDDEVDIDTEDGGPIETDITSAPGYDFKVTRDESPVDVMNHPLDARERAVCLSLPPTCAQRLRQIADSIDVTRPRRPLTKILEVERYLDEHHKYSLSFRAGTGDPVLSFLNSDKPAHCEYFASSSALLLRAMGLPTRYVVGYYAHESVGGDEMVVRGRDAHAWVECWIDGTGWMTVDATPSAGMPDHDATAIPFWQHWWERLQDIGSFMSRLVTMLSATQVVQVVAIVCVGLIVVAIIRKRVAIDRIRRDHGKYTLPSVRVSRLLVRFEKLLAGLGLPCPENCTWEHHILGLAIDNASRAELLSFVHKYNQIRFGVSRDKEHLISESETALTTLEQTLTSKQLGRQVAGREEGR
jgi:hypothetical protein